MTTQWIVKRVNKDGLGGANRLEGWAIFEESQELCFDSDEGSEQMFQAIADAHNQYVAASFSQAKAFNLGMKIGQSIQQVSVELDAIREKEWAKIMQGQIDELIPDAARIDFLQDECRSGRGMITALMDIPSMDVPENQPIGEYDLRAHIDAAIRSQLGPAHPGEKSGQVELPESRPHTPRPEDGPPGEGPSK